MLGRTFFNSQFSSEEKCWDEPTQEYWDEPYLIPNLVQRRNVGMSLPRSVGTNHRKNVPFNMRRYKGILEKGSNDFVSAVCVQRDI